MAQKDSMFLVEVDLEELNSFIDEKHCFVTARFGDLFCLSLDDTGCKRASKSRGRRKMKGSLKKARSSASRASGASRYSCATRLSRSPSLESKLEAGNSVLFESNIDSLIESMTQYPMEISLYSRVMPDFKIGSGSIPWNKKFIDFLTNIKEGKLEQEPIVVKDKYFIYHEYKSKRMATITLSIKLSNLECGTGFSKRSLSIKDSRFLQRLRDYESVPSHLPVPTPSTDYPETGTIRTIYSKRKEQKFASRKITKVERNKFSGPPILHSPPTSVISKDTNNTSTLVKSIITFVRSDTDILMSKQPSLIRSQSTSSIDFKTRFATLNYIFSDPNGSYGNGVYYVGYFTVQNVDDSSRNSATPGSKGSPTSRSPVKGTPSKETTNRSPSKSSTNGDKSPQERPYLKFRICDSECQNQDDPVAQSQFSLDLPENIGPYVEISKCGTVVCEDKKYLREPLSPPDDRKLVDLASGQKECCKVEEVDVSAKLIFNKEPCFCSCECTFGFIKKTTYCNVCGGFEKTGEEIGSDAYPCPIYHKLAVGKTKSQPYTVASVATAGSDSKKKSTVDDTKTERDTRRKTITEDIKTERDTRKKMKTDDIKTDRDTRKKITTDDVKTMKRSTAVSEKKSIDSEKDKDKEKDNKEKKKAWFKEILKDERFKFNYGYTAPKIGHSKCILSGCGTSGQAVPKSMGWLWTAECVPGLKPRPDWKPGAAHKLVVRMLKEAKNPEQVIAKRRKREQQGKKKRPPKRPLLVVEKKDGEYTVTMETMKTYNKPRTLNQPPFEDKDPITYTIGRTEEENKMRRMKKERKARRLQREQRDFIQKAFRNMCDEICMKTYRQALGIMRHTDDPLCSCCPAIEDGQPRSQDHSCSCSDTLSSLDSNETDDDEWIVEFTPPNAYFDPAYKAKKITSADVSTQYTYLDYQVKLLDRYGNPIPRFFKGPDGKQQCSDLGGFWSADHKWLEINNDGFIGPDGRWAPYSFFGPHGETVDAEDGKFQTSTGEWLIVGEDGYVDCQNRWRSYNKPKPRPKPDKTKKTGTGMKHGGRQGNKRLTRTKTETTFSCFGDASPEYLANMGLVGHGHDRKLLLNTLKHLVAQGGDVKIPQKATVPRSGRKNKTNYAAESRKRFLERSQCNHKQTSSAKGIIAVDERGRKTYFTLTPYDNKRPKERLAAMGDYGISLSSFHVPCLASFINSEVMKQQQYEHILEHNARYMKNVAGQTDR